VSDEERLARAAAIIKRAANNGLTAADSGFIGTRAAVSFVEGSALLRAALNERSGYGSRGAQEFVRRDAAGTQVFLAR
jgi:hypothetical protein